MSATPHNAFALKGVEPARLWHHFSVMSSVPRPSFKEGGVKSWLKQFAHEHELSWREDDVGNVLIGYYPNVSSEAVLLQGHIDMVTERTPDSTHDFDRDPLRLHYDGDRWLTAEQTTLGADNGVGVCAALAILERAVAGEISVPPLEVLCTVAEEVGLVGAFGLDVATLGIHATRLLNLDSEDWPDIFVGCAGGGDSLLRKTVAMEHGARSRHTFTVSGLPGGHSGLDIHRGIGNAVVVAAELAAQLMASGDARLVSISGGDKRNALARDAVVCVDVPEDFDLEGMMGELKESISHADARLSVTHGSTRDDDKYICTSDARSILSLLLALPHGPIKFEADGNTQTSNNVASIKGEGDAYVVQCSTRSSVDAHLERIRRSIRMIGEQLGYQVEQNEAYPGWRDAGDSPLRKHALDAIRDTTGLEPKIRTIHAGLEAGILKRKIEAALGKCDAIALGPTIINAHSPDEACDVRTTQEFYAALESLLERLV
jgi:dipeptidase D